MTYSDYSLTFEEYQMFLAAKTCRKLEEIWSDLVARVSADTLKSEADKKGYALIDNPDLEEDEIAVYKMIVVPEASSELENYMNENLYPFVVCLKE
jgi:hypothetical protein